MLKLMKVFFKPSFFNIQSTQIQNFIYTCNIENVDIILYITSERLTDNPEYTFKFVYNYKSPQLKLEFNSDIYSLNTSTEILNLYDLIFENANFSIFCQFPKLEYSVQMNIIPSSISIYKDSVNRIITHHWAIFEGIVKNKKVYMIYDGTLTNNANQRIVETVEFYGDYYKIVNASTNITLYDSHYKYNIIVDKNSTLTDGITLFADWEYNDIYNFNIIINDTKNSTNTQTLKLKFNNNDNTNINETEININSKGIYKIEACVINESTIALNVQNPVPELLTASSAS